uniref:Uncharacterized protein n=1 Tax=viral metagenome TaxID=1070528 RepID=A0A6C0K5F6_9ZZZZ
MGNLFVESHDDFLRSRKKCTRCYKGIWALLILCIILIASGFVSLVYTNETLGLIALCLGVSLGLVLFSGLIVVCIGWCLRPERLLPVSSVG